MSQQLQDDIEQVEMTIEYARGLVVRGQLAEKLTENPDFKKLIMDGYFVDEAARLVHLYSDPTLPNEIRETITRDLNGPGALKRYLSAIVQMGHNAENEIVNSEEALDDLREEELLT